MRTNRYRLMHRMAKNYKVLLKWYLLNFHYTKNDHSAVACGRIWADRSLCDTSMKLGTNDLHIILIIKIQSGLDENPRWPPNFKMAAMFFGFCLYLFYYYYFMTL